MKKHFFTLFLFTLLSACFAQELPVFENDSNASVIDTNMIYSKADTFRFINNTEYGNFKVNVFCYDGTNWNLFGNAEIKMQGDTAFLSKIIDKDVKKYRYYAIQLNNMLDKSYSFSFLPQMKHHDIYITITKINNDNEQNISELIGLKPVKTDDKYERMYEFETSVPKIKLAKLWLADNISSATITIYDEDLNVLAGRGEKNITSLMFGSVSYSYSYKVSIKGNQVTVRFYDAYCKTNNNPKYKVNGGTTGASDLMSDFERLSFALKDTYASYE